MTKEVTAWTETTNYPDAITNRNNAIEHDGYIYNIGGAFGVRQRRCPGAQRKSTMTVPYAIVGSIEAPLLQTRYLTPL
ncbi:MAG: hypothetical protein R3A10_18855 [Caldilineaceae bacterium]